MSNKTKQPQDEEMVEAVVPVAPPEPTEAELIARRNAALAEYGIKDERISDDDDE